MPCNISATVRHIGVANHDVTQIVARIFHRLRTPRAIVSIHFVGDRRMRRLNRLYRGLDRPTDVLSFAVKEGPRLVHSDTDDWGDIFLDVPYIQRQARRLHISYREECLRMLIHGILHSAGYDHVKGTDAAMMFALQESLLKKTASL